MPYIVPWSSSKKIGFRFISSFFILFAAPFSIFFGYYNQFIQFVTQQLGSKIIGIQQPLSTEYTASSDTLYNWLSLLTYLLLALLITIIWSLLDRKRPSYRIFSKWFFLFISYYLMVQMLIYGFIKVFNLQFGSLSLEQLFQSYGYSSPLRLMWTFMGASHTYSFFSGMIEVVAGVLLIFRRTRVLGGMAAFGVMLNVFVMNISYDVPVKLFSFIYMCLGLLIVLADYRRWWALLIEGKNEIPITVYQPIFQLRRNQRILIVFQTLFVGLLVVSQILAGTMNQKQYGKQRTKPALYGIYTVDKFVKNQQVVPPLVTDSLRWHRLLIDYPNFVTVITMDNQFKRYRAKTDTVKKQMILSTRQDTTSKYVMKYTQTGKDLRLSGILQNKELDITFKYYSLKNFLLLNRGFHWVNEAPYNHYLPK